jgi:hypothetical protein
MAAQVLAVVKGTLASQAGGPYNVEDAGYGLDTTASALSPAYFRVSSMQSGCSGDIVCLVSQSLLAGLVNGQLVSITISYGAGVVSQVTSQ